MRRAPRGSRSAWLVTTTAAPLAVHDDRSPVELPRELIVEDVWVHRLRRRCRYSGSTTG